MSLSKEDKKQVERNRMKVLVLCFTFAVLLSLFLNLPGIAVFFLFIIGTSWLALHLPVPWTRQQIDNTPMNIKLVLIVVLLTIYILLLRVLL